MNKLFVSFCSILFCCVSQITFAQHSVKTIQKDEIADTLSKGAMLYQVGTNEAYIYGKPKLFGFFPNVVKDFKQFGKTKYSVNSISAMFFGTVALVLADQDIIKVSQQFGRYIHLAGDNNQKNISPVKFAPLFVPTDLASGLYYIGDGVTEIAIDMSFLVYGLVKKDNRALQTASQLTEGLITMGITTQLIKHLTGRETPMRASVAGGKWVWFPDPIIYTRSVPTYDAYPSGHLATAMMAVTVISSNYPEYKFIKPVGYSLMALCGYQMMNNGVHWFSDYPLALAIGYTFGKMAVNRGRLKVIDKNTKDTGYQFKPTYEFTPTLLQSGTVGMSLRCKF